ncbi:MAG TPA: hypothetical protein VL947_05245, partial [Cytophagales bacterium]|nr:hypothetical protein [Cytophagales bacterium]
FIQFGETNADKLNFYLQKGKSITKLFSGKTSFSGNVKCHLRVSCSAAGQWDFYLEHDGLGTYLHEGSIVDNSVISSSHFGFHCAYATASRWDQYFFDDLYIKEIVKDTMGPLLSKSKIITDSSILLTFNEKPLALHVLRGDKNETLVYQSADSLSVIVKTSAPLRPGSICTLTVMVHDRNDNKSHLLVHIPYPRSPQARELRITEIMADESPSQGLPEYEYLEIYNGSTDYLSTKYCILSDGLKTFAFPDSTLPPKCYFLLCTKTNVLAFDSLPNKIVMASLPSLTNSGKRLSLEYEAYVIDEVSYNDLWYRDADKSEGGWSLELQDLDNFCLEEENWKASVSTYGGTPSKENSIIGAVNDAHEPALLAIDIVSDTAVHLKFNNRLGHVDMADVDFKIDDVYVKRVQAVANSGKELLLHTSRLDTGVYYRFQVSHLSSCSGKQIPVDTQFIMTRRIKGGNLLINEVLFNAHSTGTEFIEFFNQHVEPLNIKGLYISKLKNGKPYNSKLITTADCIIPSQSLWVLTADKASLYKQYHDVAALRTLQPDLWPEYNNDTGTVIIHDQAGYIIDQFHYSEKMHHPLLQNTQGVSLEKIRPDGSSGSFLWT